MAEENRFDSFIERAAENKAKRAEKWESTKAYNKDFWDNARIDNLESRIAREQDCISMQDKRAKLTAIFFPNIAVSERYKAYVKHNKMRHQRKINKLMSDMNGEIYEAVER